MRATTLRLPEPPPDDFQSGQHTRERQAGPRVAEPYSATWCRRNNIPPAHPPSASLPSTANDDLPLCIRQRLNPIDRPALEHKAEQLHKCGCRALAEFIIETIAAHPGIRADVHARLDRFTWIPGEVCAAVGGDKLTPSTVHSVVST